MCINYKRKAIKRPNSVDTGRANPGLAVFCVPQLKVAATSLGTSGSKLQFYRPFRQRYSISLVSVWHLMVRGEKLLTGFVTRQNL